MEKLLLKLTGECNPDSAIRKLVREGLSSQVQQAMDIVRVTGNKSLHGYTIASDAENVASVNSLIELLDFIVEDRITKPKAIGALYERLPQEEVQKIDKKDLITK